MNEWAELGRALDALAARGRAEVREDGEWFAELDSLHCELHNLDKSPLLHLWSSERNLTRRLLRIRERTEDRIVLEVQRFGRAKPGRLEFLRTDSRRSAGRIQREQFRERMRRMLAEGFPDAEIGTLTTAPDLEHSFSGLYVRGLMRESSRAWAVLGVSPAEKSAAIDGILTFGILWLDWTRNHSERAAIEGLRLFVPCGTSGRLRERTLALGAGARTEIFEFREADGRLERIDPADAGNADSWLVPRSESEAALSAARDAASRIPWLGSRIAATRSDIRMATAPGTNEVALSFHGLDFARWSAGEGIRFGLGESKKNVTEANKAEFERLIERLELHRHSLGTETNHALYRAAPERWLETLVMDAPTELDAQLDARYLYSQVPAMAAGDRGVLDLLGVTRRGRLVVIELKAGEDIQMPLQAVDYWLRVRRHQRDGDFQRCGYFSGIELDPQPPLIWLVAPALRFHPAIGILLRYLAPEIRVTQVGLNEKWRRRLKVMFRH